MSALLLPDGSEFTLRDLAKTYIRPAGPLGQLVADHMQQRSKLDYERAIDILHHMEHGVLLEIGCADGRYTEELWRALSCGQVWGLDHSAEMIEAARERNSTLCVMGGASFFEGDADRLPIATASVDAVLCLNTLIFLPDARAAFLEWRRVLRPRGRLVISWPLYPKVALPEDVDAMVHWRAVLEVVGLLDQAGFGTVKSSGSHEAAPERLIAFVEAEAI